MLIVGELINSSRKSIARAAETHDRKTIQKLAKDQVDAGAQYIDVNAGIFEGKEADYLRIRAKINSHFSMD